MEPAEGKSAQDIQVVAAPPEPSPSLVYHGDTGGGNQSGSGIGIGKGNGFVPLVTVVGFHHARGPEVESWFGVDNGTDPAVDYEWSLLPFMALSDGAHASTSDFSYFTLLRPSLAPSTPATSLFGISCTRQIDATTLLDRPADVTRSTVQKAVVVIADSPHGFGMLRERLGVVTSAWFAQREFTDTEILRRFQESLAEERRREEGMEGPERAKGDEERDEYLGMSLRELVREFRWQTLVLFKCCLLQPKMLFFGTRCERLCMMQFSLISLVPGLIRNLQDCADPELDSYERNLVKPTSLKTSDRNSLLSYMGLPLQIFGKGSLFGPYTPLQQLDVLADHGTKSYIVGSTNSLLLQPKDRYSDILINLDETTIEISSPSLRSALTLSPADRRWIDFITQAVNDTWDEGNPGRPKTMGYVGSEEFIRLQFEDYLLSLISAVKCHNYLISNPSNPKLLPQVDGDPTHDFGVDWIDAWTRTRNYAIWDRNTDSHLFDIVPPNHPCAGGLTIDDVQRRVLEQVKDLHLDERFAVGKEVLGKNLQAGKERASTVFNKLYADMEALREAQRRKHEEQRREAEAAGRPPPSPGFVAPDLSAARQTVQNVGTKAGAYLGSWGSWVGEKRKTGWGRSGGGGGGGGAKEKEKEAVPIVPVAPVTPATIPAVKASEEKATPSAFQSPTVSVAVVNEQLPPSANRQSYKESLFDADADATDGQTPAARNLDLTSELRTDVPRRVLIDDAEMARAGAGSGSGSGSGVDAVVPSGESHAVDAEAERVKMKAMSTTAGTTATMAGTTATMAATTVNGKVVE